METVDTNVVVFGIWVLVGLVLLALAMIGDDRHGY